MNRELDAELLPTFLAVLEHGRIAAAARAVHLSQPAVSARIRRLEEALGTVLFERSASGVSPTPAGERLAVHAREVQRALDRAVAEVGATDSLGKLSILASTTIAAHVLPATLAAYRAQHPEVELDLRIGNTETVIAAVRDGHQPIGLVEGHRRASGVRLEPWVDDELQLVIGRGAPSTWRLREVSDLERVPLLWRETGSGTRAVLSRALRGAGVRSKPTGRDLVLGSNEAITSGIAAGLGVGFLSAWSVGPHVAAGRVRTVPGLGLQVRRTFCWAVPTGGCQGTAAHFMRFATRTPPTPGAN